MKASLISKKILALATALTMQASAYAASSEDEDFSYDNYQISAYKTCEIYDPYENINRKIFIFNAVLDSFILSPVARIYSYGTNDYQKARVGSFLGNIREPLSTVNYAMQGKGEPLGKSFWRFVVNTTLGVGGLFDVASKFNLTQEPQSFANTLEHYGVGAGPYLVVPFFGGMSAREFVDNVALTSSLNPLKYSNLHKDFWTGETVVRLVHSREKLLPFTDYVSKNSTDPYISIRDAILSQKESKASYQDSFVCPVVLK